MKSTINLENTKTDSEYGCLKIWGKEKGRRFIVLFYSYKKGVVVYSEHKDHVVGDSSTYWSEEEFTPFNGTVTLSND